MARLNNHLDSDDELPELSSILGPGTEAIIRNQPKTPRQENGDIEFQEKETQNLPTESLLPEKPATGQRILTEVYLDKPQSRKQRPLGDLTQAHVNSLLLPVSDVSVNNSKQHENQSIDTFGSVATHARPRRLANGSADYSRLAKVSTNTVKLMHHDDCSYTDLSGFIVPDSASDEESLASRSPKENTAKEKNKQKQKQKNRPSKSLTANPHEQQPQSNTRQSSGTADMALPEEKNRSRTCLESLSRNELFKLLGAHSNLNDRLVL